MGIRTRITGKAERVDLQRKAKGRHPILKLGSRNYAVYQTILLEGNPKQGITAAEISAKCGQYHPQILKDLIDYRLVMQWGKRGNENLYVADPAGRGAYIQEVTVEVELLEDEHGRFFTRTFMPERHRAHGKIVRALGTRKIHFRVPLPNEPGVSNIVGNINVDDYVGPEERENFAHEIIDVEATAYPKDEKPLLLLPSRAILEDAGNE